MNELFWAVVSLIGDPIIWSVMIIGLIIFYLALEKKKGSVIARKRRRLKKFLLLIVPVFLMATLGSESLKLVFQVPRPCIPCPAEGCNVYCPVTYSFPSGHTMVMTGIVTAIYLLMRKPKYLLLYALPVMVGISRIMLGVHTETDVVAGFMLGLSITLVVWGFRKDFYRWKD